MAAAPPAPPLASLHRRSSRRVRKEGRVPKNQPNTQTHRAMIGKNLCLAADRRFAAQAQRNFGLQLPVGWSASSTPEGEPRERRSHAAPGSAWKKNMASSNLDEVVITADELPLGSLAPRVVCPTAGAIATFIGTTRDNFEGKRVLRLEVRACRRPCACTSVILCRRRTFAHGPTLRSALHAATRGARAITIFSPHLALAVHL